MGGDGEAEGIGSPWLRNATRFGHRTTSSFNLISGSSEPRARPVASYAAGVRWDAADGCVFCLCDGIPYQQRVACFVCDALRYDGSVGSCQYVMGSASSQAFAHDLYVDAIHVCCAESNTRLPEPLSSLPTWTKSTCPSSTCPTSTPTPSCGEPSLLWLAVSRGHHGIVSDSSMLTPPQSIELSRTRVSSLQTTTVRLLLL